MATGVSVSQPPVVLVNTANALSQKYFAPILADAIFKPSPTWWRITRLGKKLQGGSALVWPVVFQEETVGGAYWGTQILDTTATDSIQPAELQWKFYNQPITVPYTDVLLNRGPGAVIDLIAAKEETAMGSLLQKLSRALWGTSPQNTSLDLDSIVSAVQTNTNVYATIDRSVALNAFWKPGGTNAGTRTATGNLILADMQNAYGDVIFGNEEVDTIIMTQLGFNAYWNLLVGNIRYIRDEETTRMGFKRHLMFNNAVVLHDQFAASQTATFLNTKYVYPCFHQDDYFVVDPFIRPSNQRILSSFIWVTMNLKVINPRMNQALTGISNG